MVAILGALVWYVEYASDGSNTLVMVLTNTNPSYFLLAFLAYFLINMLFTIRIIRVLQRQGIKATFGRTFLAHYSGMLTSDFTHLTGLNFTLFTTAELGINLQLA